MTRIVTKRSRSISDRAAARLVLADFPSPTEMRAARRSSDVFTAALLMVAMLLQVARPLPPALKRTVHPWLVALGKQRQAFLLVARREARRRERAAR